MDIWLSDDACPVAIGEIIAKAAHKRAITGIFIANRTFSLLSSPEVSLYQVPSGFDGADKAIEQRGSAGNLVISFEVPLPADVLAKSALDLTSRGERYTENNIKQRLETRDFMGTTPSSGAHTGGIQHRTSPTVSIFLINLIGFLPGHNILMK